MYLMTNMSNDKDEHEFVNIICKMADIDLTNLSCTLALNSY